MKSHLQKVDTSTVFAAEQFMLNYFDPSEKENQRNNNNKELTENNLEVII